MRSYLSRLTVLSLVAAAAWCARPAAAGPTAGAGNEWAHWRGPYYNGSSDAKDLPEKFGPAENHLWSATLPGVSNGTPILLGDHIFTTALDPGSQKLIALCVGRKDGKIVWQKEVGIASPARKGNNNMATPSPVTDGKTVYFMFGTGDLAAFDLDGKPLWSRNIPKQHGNFNINWIYGSSPTIYKGKLYVQVLHKDSPYRDTLLPGAAPVQGAAPSYILAIDPATGKDLWKHVRPSDAVAETLESYATPIPHVATVAGGTKTEVETTTIGGVVVDRQENETAVAATPREEIVIVGGDAVTGHNPDTGKELWRYTGWDPQKRREGRLVPSVVIGQGIILAAAPKNGPVMAIREGASGAIPFDKAAWMTPQGNRDLTTDVAVPLFYKDQFYVLNTDGKKLLRVEPTTGQVKWTTPLGGSSGYRASPTGADGKIYCMSLNGDVRVVSPEDGKILHQITLDIGGPRGQEGTPGSIAVADGIVLARCGTTLYAFGKK